MLGTGGSALVAKTLGEGRKETANRYFTMMIYLTLILGVLLSIIGIVFMRPISILLGATDSMLTECVVYGRTVLFFNTAFMLQNVFQSFLITAEKPKLGLWVTVAAGLSNMVLDALFIAGFHWGVAGAALATGPVSYTHLKDPSYTSYLGITMAAMMYAQIPAPPKQVRIIHASRTSVGSISKYSAIPPHTPHSI